MSSLQHGVSLKALLQNPDLFDPAKVLAQGLFIATILYSYVRTGKTYVFVTPVSQLAIEDVRKMYACAIRQIFSCILTAKTTLFKFIFLDGFCTNRRNVLNKNS